MDKLVSIISPCYNGEKYIPYFLESVLYQTYRPIELIFVDDGSKDNTKVVFEEYRKLLEESGISTIYIYQDNSGQASAINKGLPIFKGEYLMWVDSDDIILPDNVSEKVKYLEEHTDKGFVLCSGEIVNVDDREQGVGLLARINDKSLNNLLLFEDLIMEKNVVYVPATIMSTREAIINAIPTLHIYEGRQGQNWQLMLPLAYTSKYGIIDKILFKYVVHNDSHSHSIRNYQAQQDRNNEFTILLRSTIDNINQMSDEEKFKWKRVVDLKYVKRNFELACFNRVWEDVIKYKRRLAAYEEINLGYYLKVSYYCFRIVGSKIKRLMTSCIK